ncbi:MAG: TlpA family protein disulfide reductase [Thermodesulfobacteriota bacterium]|nr:MAG: TlpA family protein disulfide reductase [Thermodesulfobacteriota bacterium]
MIAFFKKIFNRILLFLVWTILLSACQGEADPSMAPDFMLLNLRDESVNLSQYRGQVVLINFFATSCPPCRAEIPDFISLQDKYGSKGFTVIGISVDQNGKRILPRFVKALGINYPVLLATSKVIRDYGNVYALPASFLIDRNHRILKHYTGMVTRHELEPVIVNALGIK